MKPHVRWRWSFARLAWSVEFEGMAPIWFCTNGSVSGHWDEIILAAFNARALLEIAERVY